MKAKQFRTNIMCSSCIAKVTPVLNEITGENNWKIDIQNSEKILTVNGDRAEENNIINALQKVGYRAEEFV